MLNTQRTVIGTLEQLSKLQCCLSNLNPSFSWSTCKVGSQVLRKLNSSRKLETHEVQSIPAFGSLTRLDNCTHILLLVVGKGEDLPTPDVYVLLKLSLMLPATEYSKPNFLDCQSYPVRDQTVSFFVFLLTYPQGRKYAQIKR